MNYKNDFFSNTNPELISSKSLNELNETLIVSETGKNMVTLADTSKNFYKKYIQPNVIPIAILLLFITFMIYRYMTSKQTNKKHKSKKEKFDPSKPIDSPEQTKLELSETTHHKLDNVINNIIVKNEIDEILNDEDMYKDLYKPSDDEFNREDYYGTKNKSENDIPIKMEHPYNYDGDFISMENNMLRFASEQNKSKLDEAASMLWS